METEPTEKTLDLEKICRDAIRDTLDVNSTHITPEASFHDDLDADSLTLVELELNVEDALEITIPDFETTQYRTVQEFIDFVRRVYDEQKEARP